MITSKTIAALLCGALIVSAGAASAQSSGGSARQPAGAQENRVGQILGALFGDRLGTSTSIESQWTAGRKPLATQRTQFNTRIDADVRSGALTSANGARMKADYDQLVALEARYGADGRFTTQERAELSDRYGDLTQALTEGGYAEGGEAATLSVAAGRAEFDRRVDAGVASRRLTRVQGTRLKSDYAALVQAEEANARDGLSEREKDDLDVRLDALDARVGDTAYSGGAAVLDNRTRLANIERALSGSGLTAALQAQVRVELGDLTRLDAAYARAAPTGDDQSYLERRIANLETRARVRR